MANHDESYNFELRAPGFITEAERLAAALKAIGTEGAAAGRETAGGLDAAVTASQRLRDSLARFTPPAQASPYNLGAGGPQPYYDPRLSRFVDPVSGRMIGAAAAQSRMPLSAQYGLPPEAQSRLPQPLPTNFGPDPNIGPPQYPRGANAAWEAGASRNIPPGAEEAFSGRSPSINQATQNVFIGQVEAQMKRVTDAMIPLDARMQRLRDQLAEAAPSTLTDSLAERVKTAQRSMESVASQADVAGRRLTERPPTNESGLLTAERSLDTAANSADTGLTRIDTLITRLQTKIQGLMTQSGQMTFVAELETGIETVESRLQGLTTRVGELRASLGSLPAGPTFDTLNRQVTTLETSIAKLGVGAAKTIEVLRIPPSTTAEAEKLGRALGSLEASTSIAAGSASVKLEQLGVRLRDLNTPAGQAQLALEKVDSELRKKPGDAEAAGSAFSKFWSRAGSVATGFLIVNVLNDLSNAVRGVATGLINSPAQFQTYQTSLTQIMGSAAAAKKELSTVTAEAVFAPQSIDQVVTMDEKLNALLGTSDQLQARFGRSMSEVRTAILDTSATFPKLDPSVLAKDFKVLEERPSIALRSLETMGVVTRDELAKQGVQFDRSGAHILSSYTTNFNALLNVLQQKYGGMAAAQSSTFEGMKQNLGDFMTRAGAILGQDVFAVINQRLHDFIMFIQTPQVQATLEDWGQKLGKLANAAFIAFDGLVKGIQTVLFWIRPLTDAFGLLIDALPSPDSSIAWTAQQAAALVRAKKATDDAAAAQQTLADEQKTAQDGITRLDRASQDLRDTYGDQIKSLQELSTQMDRTFNADKADRSMAALRKKIAEDTALAKDVYSSEGRAAAERLPQEQLQLTDAIAQQNHDNAKNRIADEITGKQKVIDDGVRANENAKRMYQDQLEALKDTNNLQSQIDAMNFSLAGSGAKAGQSLGDSFKGAIAPLRSISAFLGSIGGEIGVLARAIMDPLTKNWNSWMDVIKHAPNPIKDVTDALGLLKGALGGNFPDVMKFWGDAFGGMLDNAVTVAQAAGEVISMILSGIALQIAQAAQQFTGLGDLVTGKDMTKDLNWQREQTEINTIIGHQQEELGNLGKTVGDWLSRKWQGSLLGGAADSIFNQMPRTPGPSGPTGPALPPPSAIPSLPPGYSLPPLQGASALQKVEITLRITDAVGKEWFRQLVDANAPYLETVLAGQFAGHK